MNSNYTKFTLTEAISTEQRNFFEEHGFVHFKDFINPDRVQLIIKASLEVEKKWIEKDIEKVNGVPIKYGVDINGSPIVQRFAFINQHHPVLGEFLLDTRFKTLLDL